MKLLKSNLFQLMLIWMLVIVATLYLNIQFTSYIDARTQLNRSDYL